MREQQGNDPRWVDVLLDWRWTWTIARLLVVGLYLISGILKLVQFPSAVQEQAAVGLHPPALWAALTILVEIGAPLLILSGRFIWLGAGALGVFTGLAAFIAHHFWTLHGVARFNDMNDFMEHFSIIGGYMMTALVAEHIERTKRARQ
ncbi:Uncharacterized membrane protein YphA, DoxX/SURF4 family [Sphingomonas gellani]|uniref:Uncharacterized membrane protein YphA, DoxX/SURF4 family n=1 Tax=Sphingomonas gellani TaxID=1166340 RepID=A0A1H8GHU0_9SPHN|nr:DoxX family protein [Sphingomonas gellani]SEN43369.1 Uncharacterized membrane protein YphA, DoxX/SURF4 family [Sphingomonas gellani]